jgi:ribosomal protein S18 acetylase RimI-like enzyme
MATPKTKIKINIKIVNNTDDMNTNIAKQIEKLNAVIFPSPNEQLHVDDILDLFHSNLCIIAEFDGNIIGNLMCNYEYKELTTSDMLSYFNDNNLDNMLLIWSLSVDPAYRNKGIGQAMIQLLFDKITENKIDKHLYLQVRKSNVTAYNLYKKMGFINETIIDDYYHNPTEDAIIMMKTFIFDSEI